MNLTQEQRDQAILEYTSAMIQAILMDYTRAIGASYPYHIELIKGIIVLDWIETDYYTPKELEGLRFKALQKVKNNQHESIYCNNKELTEEKKDTLFYLQYPEMIFQYIRQNYSFSWKNTYSTPTNKSTY